MKEKVFHYQVKIEFAIDLKFWAILPAINWNDHSKTLEFEWLIFAMYIDTTNRSALSSL